MSDKGNRREVDDLFRPDFRYDLPYPVKVSQIRFIKRGRSFDLVARQSMDQAVDFVTTIRQFADEIATGKACRASDERSRHYSP